LEVGEEGAIVFKGEKYGLHTRVFRNKLGLPTYEAKDLGLANTKWERYKNDLSYIVTANEIDEYYKVLLKTLSLLFPVLATRTRHLSHGMMKLTSGMMSSRTGVVVTGEGLLNVENSGACQDGSA
jgi:arginyl-tRNA synthetase